MDLDVYFNEWAFLARTDPEVFERRRQEYIGSFLNHSGLHRARLEALQASIDARRASAANPQESVMAISLLMCESLCTLAETMQNLCADLNELDPPPAERRGTQVPEAQDEGLTAARRLPVASPSSRVRSG